MTTTDILTAKLQTSVAPATLEYLRVESVRRHMTMGQLLDEIIAQKCDRNLQSADVPESTS
jgi:hypothetical protein